MQYIFFQSIKALWWVDNEAKLIVYTTAFFMQTPQTQLEIKTEVKQLTSGKKG